MNRKFFGLRLGRVDFEDIQFLLETNCHCIKVRVDNGTANSLFDASISSNIKSFEEIIIECKNPSIKIEFGYQSVIVECSSYTALSRGVYEQLCEKLYRKQSIHSRVSAEFNAVWFKTDSYVPVLTCCALLVLITDVSYRVPLIIVTNFYAYPIVMFIISRVILRNRMSLISNSPRSKPMSGAISAAIGSVTSGIVLFILSQFLEFAKLKHIFGLLDFELL